MAFFKRFLLMRFCLRGVKMNFTSGMQIGNIKSEIENIKIGGFL